MGSFRSTTGTAAQEADVYTRAISRRSLVIDDLAQQPLNPLAQYTRSRKETNKAKNTRYIISHREPFPSENAFLPAFWF